MAARTAILIAALVGVLAACAAKLPKQVDFSETRKVFAPGDYHRILRTWTRHQKVVEDIGTVIEVWATYKSWEFRQAYLEYYASIYNLADAERVALAKAQLEASRTSHEFHVVVQTTDWKWNDLDKPTSAWRMTLADGTGMEIPPNAIEVQKLPEIYEMQFFPYRTPFSRTYLVRFSRAEAEAAGLAEPGSSSGRLILRVASPLAKPELTWRAR